MLRCYAKQSKSVKLLLHTKIQFRACTTAIVEVYGSRHTNSRITLLYNMLTRNVFVHQKCSATACILLVGTRELIDQSARPVIQSKGSRLPRDGYCTGPLSYFFTHNCSALLVDAWSLDCGTQQTQNNNKQQYCTNLHHSRKTFKIHVSMPVERPYCKGYINLITIAVEAWPPSSPSYQT